MVASKDSTMTDRRALLTDREREIISGEAEVSDSYRYQTISRIRARLDRLAGDLEALEAHGDLADELRERVCSGAAADSQQPQERRESAATPPPADGDQQVEASDPTPTSSSDASDTPADSSPAPADDLAAAVDRVAAEQWEDPERLESRKAAAVAVLEYAREHGSVSKAEAKEEVEPEHPVEEQSPRTWYRQTVRPVLKEVGTYSDSKRAYILDRDQ